MNTFPIIVLINSIHQDDIKASYSHGANAYMIKSIELDNWFPSFRICATFGGVRYTPEKQIPEVIMLGG